MVLSNKLNRSIRARREEDSDSDPHSSELDISSPSVLDTGEGEGDIHSSGSEAENGSELEDGEDEEADENEEELDEDRGAQAQLSKVSFGALAEAQNALAKEQDHSRKRKRGAVTSEQQGNKLLALRKRLQELKSKKPVPAVSAKTSSKRVSRQEPSDQDSDDSSSDDESPRKRSSKHAPTVQSSKKQVKRLGTITENRRPQFRDPRFDALAGPAPKNSDALSKKYAFLKDYRASEMSELKTALKKTKDPVQKETLKKQITSMENRAKAQASKDKQQEVKREHRKKEKEAIEQGKKPFYLKQSEIKQQALVDKYNSMNAKQRDKLMQRRRKKIAGKEKKAMPALRRTA